MNLAVNARDAMPNGGEIVIRVGLEAEAEGFGDAEGDRRGPAPAPGPYLRISVIDNGVGMSAEVLAQAGKAFFTTKSHGRGTGLGLAGARGFAERAGGRLSILLVTLQPGERASNGIQRHSGPVCSVDPSASDDSGTHARPLLQPDVRRRNLDH